MKNLNGKGTNTSSAEHLMEATSIKQQNMILALKQAEDETMRLFQQTIDALDNLAQIRMKCKLSNSRVSALYRELKELEKVMSAYK